MLHGDLSSILHLLWSTTQSLRKPRSCHRRGRTDLTLAADLRASNRRICLNESANRSRREQELVNALLSSARALRIPAQRKLRDPGHLRRRAIRELGTGLGAERNKVTKNSGDHASSAIRRRSDNAVTRSVFLVHRKSVEINPVHGTQRILHSTGPAMALFQAKSLLCAGTQLRCQGIRAPGHIQTTRQNTR